MGTIEENSNPSKDSDNYQHYSTASIEDVLGEFATSERGLSEKEVNSRLAKYGRNTVVSENKRSVFAEFVSKFYDPLVVLLLIVAALSFAFGQKTSGIIIITMAILGTVLSFIQEHHASKNAEKLEAMVKIRVTVIRHGKKIEVPIKEIVPGDIVELSAGKMVPADVRIISTKDLFVNQSALNGESFPVKKEAVLNQAAIKDSIYDLNSLAFMGSNVVGGYGQAVVLRTGKSTEFGKLSHEITAVTKETGFDTGIKNFTWLMIRMIMILTVLIFAINALFKGDIVDALMFALAVAVGLAPEMLPMIVTVNLSKGAMDMAKKKVIVKELDSIQNFGAMDVLCTDKTGTLTVNEIVLVKHCDIDGHESEDVIRYAYYNSFLQAGLDNLLDRAVTKHQKFPTEHIEKIDEIPFDFDRRKLSVIIADRDGRKIIAKGAPEAIMDASAQYLCQGECHRMNAEIKHKMQEVYDRFSREGFRVLAIGYKKIGEKANYSKDDEADLIFVGFIAFLDPPKPTAAKTVADMKGLGIELKVLSGDNEFVTEKICSEVQIDSKGTLTGTEIARMDDHELKKAVEKASVFARMTPMEKERVIKALKANGHIVGFMGDGINDAPALKGADVGISVENATDIAKGTAQIILLEKDLTILNDCVLEGRKTFANVIKYIKMGASSNFGNMFSMTGASLFLPFLPMLPMQLLLNNFLYDMTQIAIPTDKVDHHYLKTPRPWNINFIKEFMVYMGPISSVFDFATFGVMLYVFQATPELFHTGWFVESLLTQTLVIHVIRTNQIPFFESSPSKPLLLSSVAIVLFAIFLTYSPLAQVLGFTALPSSFFLIMVLMAGAYLLSVQYAKKFFIRKFGFE